MRFILLQDQQRGPVTINMTKSRRPITTKALTVIIVWVQHLPEEWAVVLTGNRVISSAQDAARVIAG